MKGLLVPMDEVRWWFRRATYIVLAGFGLLCGVLIGMG